MGAISNIQFLSADKPNPGLGFNLYPNGNLLHKFKVRVKKVNKNCKAVVSMYIYHYGDHIMLIQTTYGMRLTKFDDNQCHQVDARVLCPYLPLLVVHHSNPQAIINHPLQNSGIGF